MESSSKTFESKIDFAPLLEGLKPEYLPDVFLVLRGLKPVTEVIVEKIGQAKVVEQALTQLGLQVARQEWKEGYVFCVSLDRNLAEEAMHILPSMAAQRGKIHTEFDRRYGELMGFPKSAIEAFMIRESIPLPVEDKILETFGLKDNIFNYRLSKDHFKEELKQTAGWYRAILDQAPELINLLFPDPKKAKEFRSGVEKFILNFPENEVQFPIVAAEIMEMTRADQEMRMGIDTGGKWDEEIDLKNTERLKKIIEEIGWPTVTKVGAEASHGAWLLVQHADRQVSFQKVCLSLMKAEGDEQVQKRDIAMLEDRVRVNSKNPQLYGTQFWDENKVFYINGEIENLPTVDERRRDANLDTLREGVLQMYENSGWEVPEGEPIRFRVNN